MKQYILEKIFGRFIARQLRRPSGFFAKKVGEKMNESNEALYNLTIETMKLAGGDSILEIGFGNGIFFDKIFASAENLTIHGVDFSPEMVGAAEKNNPKTVKSENLVLQSGRSDKLPFSDKSFDKIFCINVVYFWEKPAEHLREIHRVLKPDGKFFCGLKSKAAMLKMPFTRHGFTLYEETELAEVLEQSGLKVVKISKKAALADGKEDEAESICVVVGKFCSDDFQIYNEN